MASEGTQGLLEKLRALRDSTLEDVAKATLAWTSSETFRALNATLSKPALLATALFRSAADAAMADLLAALNLPSRADVLTLSQRLTRIEMTLDDIGAGMDEIRRGSGSKREPANNGVARPAAPSKGTLDQE